MSIEHPEASRPLPDIDSLEEMGQLKQAIDTNDIVRVYAWEQATRLRKTPTLVEQGLLAIRPAREVRVRRDHS